MSKISEISDIDIDKLTLEKSNRGKYHNILYEDNPILIETEFLPAPFGLDESYNNKFIKLALKNIKNSLESQELYTFIETLEKKLVELIPDCDGIESQVRCHSKYDPILTVKVPMGKNSVNVEVVDKNGTPFNLYGLNKGDYVKCILLIDTVWYFRGKYSYKIKAKRIVLDRN